MKSVVAIIFGIVLALLLGLLLVFGIFAPVLTAFFGLQRTGSSALPAILLLFANGFAFYFAGMAAGYTAPSRRRLHGVLVPILAFAISPTLNFLSGNGLFPEVSSLGLVALVVVFLIVAIGAAYVGAGRGAALYVHNQSVLRKRRPRNAAREEKESSTD